MAGSLSRPALRLLTAAIIIAWPLLISLGLTHHSLNWLLPLLALILALRLWQVRHQRGPMRFVAIASALAGVALCAASWLLQAHQWLLFYPVVINALLLAVFGASLWSPMPLVERLARLNEPQLSAAGIRYTRNVTRVWCGFFVANGGIALFTALHGNMALWSLWNGALSYLAIGALMGGEWLLRQHLKRREAR